MCQSCEALRINGILCHETGCPDAWKGSKRSCQWCGQEFTPEHSRQQFCDNACYGYYYNLIDGDFIGELES
jgi:hypothetical protein